MHYFTRAELTRTSTGLPNEPAPEQWAALVALVDSVLDPLREYLDKPVIVTSGYRSAAVNEAIRGSVYSQHMLGEAADIRVAGMSARDLARTIHLLGLPFDQLIWYDVAPGKPSVHVSHTTRRVNRLWALHWIAEPGTLDDDDLEQPCPSP